MGPYFNDEFGDTYIGLWAFTGDGFYYPELKTFAKRARDAGWFDAEVEPVTVKRDGAAEPLTVKHDTHILEEPSAEAVFVDASGARRARARAVMAATALVCVGFLGLVALGDLVAQVLVHGLPLRRPGQGHGLRDQRPEQRGLEQRLRWLADTSG